MIVIDTSVRQNETLEQYLWRLGNNREALDLTWNEIAELINKEFRSDDEALTESAYRKKYAAAKQFYDEVFTKEDFKSEDIEEQRRELLKLKQQLRDERTSLSSRMRSEARLDQNFSYLSDKLQEIGRVSFGNNKTKEIEVNSDNDLIVCLSDLHLGAENYSFFGSYNTQIAKQKLDDYFDKIVEIGRTHHSENVYVCLLGDLINGNIHPSVQLSNRENFVDQIKISSETISSFCADLALHFNNVYVTGVPGNHSRIMQNKEDCLRDERADSLILWICKQILSNIKNVKVNTDIYDSSIATIQVRHRDFWLVHGDNDAPTDASIGKLTLMMGYIPYAILAGHRHSMFYREFNNVKYIQAGSLCTGGDYEVQKRLTDKPNQTVLVVNDKGIDAIYNVELN